MGEGSGWAIDKIQQLVQSRQREKGMCIALFHFSV